MAPRDKDPILALQTIQASKFDDFENPKLQQQEDCLSCRLLGSTAFVALGTYTYASGMRQLRVQRHAIELSRSRYKYGARQLGVVSLSATLVGLGIYRLFN